MESKKVISDVIQEVLVSSFPIKKKGNYWYLRKELLIIYINLQKSSYSDQFYVNISVKFYDNTHGETYPTITQSDVGLRIDDIVPVEMKIYDLLNFETPITDQDRKNKMRYVLLHYLIPFMHDFDTIDKIRDRCLSDIRIRSTLNATAKRVLNL
jgi:hypothetical protein